MLRKQLDAQKHCHVRFSLNGCPLFWGYPMSEGSLVQRREKVISDKSLSAREIPKALSETTDEFLVDLYAREVRDNDGVALVALGGYGRAELAPSSDLDLMLIYHDRDDVDALADRIWYPLWDEGFKLGHSVRSVEQTLRLASTDLETATSLLNARLVAGDSTLLAELLARNEQQWVRHGLDRLDELVRNVNRRHRLSGEVAFLLEPDLKEGRGGLRDVHAINWAARAGIEVPTHDHERLAEAYQVLLEARVELHRISGKRGDVLLLEEQDSVAAALGDDDADVFMGRVAAAARTVAYLSDETWRHIDRESTEEVSVEIEVSGLTVTDNEIVALGDPSTDPLLVLHAAVQAMYSGLPLARESLGLFAERQVDLPDPWPQGARDLFVELLRGGHRAIPVIESLDYFEVWTHLLPEWTPNRSRPQRNVYHRFTVDRHLLETVAEAARLTHRVQRPDLLLVAALLHDVGKGYPGDHTEVGMRLIGSIASRCGFSNEDADALSRLVEHHLLLPDVATRRDLEDLQTIRTVAEKVRTVEFLELLAALTEADSIATGPTAWGDWKAHLVKTLTEGTADFISTDGSTRRKRRSFVTDQLEALMAEEETVVQGSGDTVTIVAKDRAGIFSRAAGALALRGLDVLQADAYSSDAGMAISQFRVAEPDTPVDWDRVIDDIHQCLHGHLAIDARIAERARVYRRRTASAAKPVATSVIFDIESATDATIIEVRTEDHIGVLYHLTRTLAEMGLDIRSAKIQTISNEVVDTFYVTSSDGPTLDDIHRREIEAALRHSLMGVE
ncbi:MAG: [protein-PII] uridylyltransferase [Acidimicrobiales bacterium MED-G01]|nr:MAG: [protein-PII] uridylyltransferase [Acidimicrobiales bacterium MED-G01]